MDVLQQIDTLLGPSKKSLLMTFSAIILVGLLPIFYQLIKRTIKFSEDLRSVKSEIRRTDGRERLHFIHMKKRMWISFFFPFVRFGTNHHRSEDETPKKRGSHLRRLLTWKMPLRLLTLIFVTFAFSAVIHGAIFSGVFEKAIFASLRAVIRISFYAVAILLYLWFIRSFSSKCYHRSRSNKEYEISTVAVYCIYAGINIAAWFLLTPSDYFWIFRMSFVLFDLISFSSEAMILPCIAVFHLLSLIVIILRPLASRWRHQKQKESEHQQQHHHHHHHHHGQSESNEEIICEETVETPMIPGINVK